MKDTPAWRALAAHRDALASQRIDALWARDPKRGEALTFHCGGIAADFSKQKVITRLMVSFQEHTLQAPKQ